MDKMPKYFKEYMKDKHGKDVPLSACSEAYKMAARDGKKQGWNPEPKILTDRTEKIAIIGAGPAGLSAAYYLATAGYKIKVFEKHAEIGGMLRYGIPRYRLPLEIIDYEVDMIKNLGVEIETGKTLGTDFTLSLIHI